MVRAASVTSTVVYTYNAAGLRVGHSGPSGTSVAYAWDWATGVPELLSDGDNLYLVGHNTLGQFADEAWAYYLPDALGSVRQVTDRTGAVMTTREPVLSVAEGWTPYGVEVGGAQAGLGFTGEWFDAAVGLQYLRARWYDVEVGRFTSRDSLQLESNLYIYGNANPLSYTDPTGYFSQELIAQSLGQRDFAQVVDWFDALVTAAPTALTNDPQQRWGFLALLLHANSGDRITGLSLRIFGRKHEIALGEFLSDGCNIQIIAEGKLYDLPEYIQDYLEDINASDDDRINYTVPNWRTVVHRYRLNGGKTFQDGRYTDLPDWYATSIELELFEPAILTGIGGSLQEMFLSDRYGNDYLGIQVNVGGGVNLLPFGVNYSEGYAFDLEREWGTNIPYVLDEASLTDAMAGFDVGASFTIFGLGVGASVGIQSPIYQTVAFDMAFMQLIGSSLSGSFTFRTFNDNPLTNGWNELDEIPTYDYGSF